MAHSVISRIQKGQTGILVVGNYPAVVQSVLDFDFLSGKTEPSVVAIVAQNRKAQKYFFGVKEVLISCYAQMEEVPQVVGARVAFMLNVQSGRRVFESTKAFFATFPHALGGHIFAENVPEIHAQELIHRFASKYCIVGPSGVGLLVPGCIKLGAIGGVDLAQIAAGKLGTQGNIAVGSTSGGMTNELIRAVVGAGRRVSFAIAVGGERFPTLSLTEAFLMAEKDPHTDAFVYFGELGGQDEYEIIELIKNKKFTKPLVAYIAGVIDEAFPEHVQFGHAKALVQTGDESARAKRIALQAVGVHAPDSFKEFLTQLGALPQRKYVEKDFAISELAYRQKTILSTRTLHTGATQKSYVSQGKSVVPSHAFTAATLEVLLGRTVRSTLTTHFAEAVFSLLIDHGGHVSGAVNTMITARAGKDMVSSLASGLLTIGPRFGGAVNQAAHLWLEGVTHKTSPAEFVEHMARTGELILGIGHKKYRVGLPDPRVAALAQFAQLLKKHPHYDFARAVEQVTTAKSGSLILNVDGVMAALFLDILTECEGMKSAELSALIHAEFFNALFIIPRTVGFIGHFMEQKRNDEGLFRLPDELLFERDS